MSGAVGKNTEVDDNQPFAVPESRHGNRVRSAAADPVFILAPPCTFSWIICAMLGQHPQMYGVPELHLFSADTVAEWLELCSRETYEMDHGLLRLIAEIYFGSQTDHSIARARGWLSRRSHFSTGLLLEILAQRLSPLIVVEKSPSIVFRPEFLLRSLTMFPQARFLHLVTHPLTYCEAVRSTIADLDRTQVLPSTHWLRRLSSYCGEQDCNLRLTSKFDAQTAWYALHANIAQFLRSVAADQKRQVRGEELLSNFYKIIRDVAAWLGVRTDSEALQATQHPEGSPFACLGPSLARFGSDIFLFDEPLRCKPWTESLNDRETLAWWENDQICLPEVKELAYQFGYQ